MVSIKHGSSASSLDVPQQGSSFVEMFEVKATEFARSVALRHNAVTMNYLELQKRTNRFARYLGTRGVAPGDVVAISLNRGIDLVVAMLGTLKAGAIFVPVDPHYPDDRKHFMLVDAAPKLVVVGSLAQLDSTLHSASFTLLPLDTEYAKIDATPSRALGRNARPRPGDPAYIIYTSGSTGRPKGAINTHQGLLNLAVQQISVFGVQPTSRVLQFASFSFDASVSEIVMALGAGATLILADSGDIVPGPSLVKLLQEYEVTHVTFPPSVLAVVPDVSFPALEVIIVAGEACPIELARRWAPRCRFFNAYGVSEAAVCAAMREFDPALGSLPIGSAMGGVELHVLDEELSAVRVGEVGELYIGGVGVGLGYLNRPDLTREKFLDLNIGAQGPARFYKTGDRVRLLLDKSLEYVGRTDNQVKVRGFRVELDEIAYALEDCELVIQAAVVLRTDEHGHKKLVAFIKPSRNEEVPTVTSAQRVMIGQIRSFLMSRLPAHMIPSNIIALQTFPLSPNGKIDLAELRSRVLDSSPQFCEGNRSPETETELILARLCADLLGTDQIPFDSSFLDLGGDSLQAAQLVWRIQEEFSIQISQADIIDSKDLFDLAQRVEATSRRTLPVLEALDRSAPVDPAPAQEIFGLLETLGIDTSPLNCCASYEIAGDIDIELLDLAHRDLFARHEGLRLTFPMNGDGFKLSAFEHVDPSLEIVDLRSTPNQAQKLSEFFAIAERIRFDLRKDLLVRSFFVRLESRRAILITIAHHAIFDAWSLLVFLQDLFALVAERKTGKKILEPLRIQYLDYVVYLRKTLALRDFRREEAYLSQVFKRPLHHFDLKSAKPRPPRKTLQGGNRFDLLSRDETTQLRVFCESRKLTPFMVCTALLKAALYLNSHQNDITVGGPVSIRYHRELERQIGLYGAAYILRTIFHEKEPVSRLLERVSRNLLEAYRCQVHSITEVLQKYELEADLSRTAPYDISIASHMFDIPLSRPGIDEVLGIRLSPYRYPLTTGFFDFEFTFHLFDGEIDLETRFDAALYEENDVAAVTSDFRKLLVGTIKSPNSNLGEIVAG